jgi:DNA-binding transcriptional MerR regulator/methylmalonyl-CoA mutase cobalamin-binding subunit
VFRIRHAAKLAGVNPTLLRAWERRYHLVSPTRTSSGYRVYSAADVEVLRAAARLVAAGHTIGEIARLPANQLTQVAARLVDPADTKEADTPPGDERPKWEAPVTNDPATERSESEREAAVELALEAALEAIERFDRQQFEAALFPVTTMTGISPVGLCETVMLPLLHKIGDRWESGELTVAAEHFGSALCRAKILQCLEFVARSATGPRMVCACPENELHEGGLLAFAVRAATAQWQVIYLGAHTPMQQALDTAVRIAADLVALSLTVPRTAEQMATLVQAVAQAKAERQGLRVIAGGLEAIARRNQLEAGGVEVPVHIQDVVALPARVPRIEKTRDR